jgi:Flp pilus assembly protein protease CpaA
LDYTWLIIDIARLVPLFIILGLAAVQDIRHGEVTNKLWLYAPIGFVVMITEYVMLGVSLLPYAFLSLTISLVAVYLVQHFVKKGWGGADTKAVATIALSYPIAPIYLFYQPFLPLFMLWVAAVLAFIIMIVKRQKEAKFIPYLLVGFVLAALA